MYLIPIELSRKEACRSRNFMSLSIKEFSFLPTKKTAMYKQTFTVCPCIAAKRFFFVIVFCAVDFFVLIFSCLYYLSSLKRTFLYLLFSYLHCLSFLLSTSFYLRFSCLSSLLLTFSHLSFYLLSSF